MRDEKTVAIFAGYYLPFLGGVERYVSKLSEALAARGYRIVIITSRHINIPSKQTDNNVTIYRLPILEVFKKRYPIPAWFKKEYKQLKSDIEQEPLDYIILNTRFHLTSLIGARLAKKMRIEPLLIEHGTSHFSVGVPVLDFFGKFYEHALTGVIKRYVKYYYGVSKKCNEWLRHFNIEAKGVFYNAISPEDAKHIAATTFSSKFNKNEVIVSYAGRLIKEKGVLNLEKAFNRVILKEPSRVVKLVVAGEGPLYTEMLKRNAGNENIEMLGYLDFGKMRELYRRTDIFVYPSLYPEGLPTSILEAALMGCAIIATPKGGTEEVIVSPQHGIIIDGSIDSIERSLQGLIHARKTRRSIGLRAHERVIESFTWAAVAEKVENEFLKLRR